MNPFNRTFTQTFPCGTKLYPCYSRYGFVTPVRFDNFVRNTDIPFYINKYKSIYDIKQYCHKVFTKVDDKFYSFPINLNVLSELFNTKIYSKEHALALINPAHFEKPASFEEAALNAVGEVIYEKFVKNYTEKQWKISCKELPVEVFKRVNIRFNYVNLTKLYFTYS